MLQQRTAFDGVSFLPSAFDLWRQNTTARTNTPIAREERSHAGVTTAVAKADDAPERPSGQVICREMTWFDCLGGGVAGLPRTRISVSRRVRHATARHEQKATLEADCHVFGILLEPMADVTVFAEGRLVHTGPLPRGSM
jgi:hypothetical protein